MNILFVCQTLPYPPDAGYKIRTFNLIKHLSKRHNISLVCYADLSSQESHVRRMEDYCELIRLVQQHKKSKIKQVPGLTKDLISGLPWNVKYSKSKEMSRAIFEITKLNRFDIIHFNNIYLATNIDPISSCSAKKTLTFHDIDSLNHQRIFKVEKNLYKKMVLFLNWLAVRRWESKIAAGFEQCIVMSSIDAQILKSKDENLKIAIIPNGVDTDSFKLLPQNDQQKSIAYFGAMDYEPNADAVLYFYKQIFPLVKKQFPAVRFVIVGRNPNSRINGLSADPNVVVTGYVENVVPYYESTSVIVVPLRAGGGTRLKILEAMALGRPVISTSLGAEGLEVTHRENIMIADKAADFANYTIELMKDVSLKTSLTKSARKFVETYHSWREIAADLDRVYQNICR